MSENILENDEALAPTSNELPNETDEPKRLKFSIYDAMMGVALFCVVAAIVVLVMELRTFGNFPFVFPWNTADVLDGGG